MNVVHVDKIQGIHGGKFIHTKPNGMTVHDLVWELQKYPSDEDVHPIVHNNKYNNKYRGVQKRLNGNFTAKIEKNRKQYYLGCFRTEEDAARAYDKKAIELFGDKAVLNFPEAL